MLEKLTLAHFFSIVPHLGAGQTRMYRAGYGLLLTETGSAQGTKIKSRNKRCRGMYGYEIW